MTQTDRRRFLIHELLCEQPAYAAIPIPAAESEQKRLLRALCNRREPHPVSDAFLHIQNAYWQEEIRRKGITDLADLTPVQKGLYLWKGDITTLRCDAIVNAANAQLLGCFCPSHGCIDNAIHTFSGVELRLACADIMRRQGHAEPTGSAKITPAFNLPCSYVLHTVGPIVTGNVTAKEREQLASCYRSCLTLADQKGINSIAFCCISTGEFHFPGDMAANIAIQTVTNYRAQTHSDIEVIFNVFKDADYAIYRRLLGEYPPPETGTGTG